MIASPLASAQDFIKALRAHPDPPHANGPSKIEIAREAWDSTDLDFPNKDEVVVDWLLTRLLKDKAKPGDANPILDSRYWQLLSDILCTPNGGEAKCTDTSRVARRWLLPLLNRTPFAPIVVAYFALSAHLDERERTSLNEPFMRSLAIIWPPAALKSSPDTLLECFGALLPYLAPVRQEADDRTDMDPYVVRSAGLIISSYRTAYSNTPNKKKLYAAFLQDHFLHWLHCSQQDDKHNDSQLSPLLDIYSAGIDTLFNVDILRSLDDHKCDAALKGALDRALLASRGAALRVLPRLFASFVQSLKRSRNTLYGQGSNAGLSHAAVQVQVDGLAFYALCEATIAGSPHSDGPSTWDTRIALLKTVDNESLYHASDADSNRVLRSSGNAAIKILTSSRNDAVLVDKAVDVLTVLAHIDFDLMAPELPVIWPMLAHCSPSSSSSSYLRLLFDFHTKTRTVNVLVDAWLDAVDFHHWKSAGLQPRDAYGEILGSPLFTFEAIDRFGQAIHAFLTPGQISEVARITVERLQSAFQQFRDQDKQVAAEDGDGARKKRRKSAVEDARIDPEYCAVEFALVARIVVVVLGSLATQTTLEDSRQELFDVVGAACAAIVPRALRAVLKALNANNRRPSWAWQIVSTGALLVYHDRKRNGWPEVRLDEDVKTQLRALLGNDNVLPEFALIIVRALLNDCASDDNGAQSVLDDVLRCLESLRDRSDVDEVNWSGRSHELHGSGAQAAVPILHLTLSRWVPLFESRATSEQLTRLAKVILGLSRSTSSNAKKSTKLAPTTILATALRSAEVWELRRFRDTFLGQLHEATAPLASVDAQKLMGGVTNLPRTLHAKVPLCIAAFEVLLHTPEEYISRSLRPDLLQRAIAADVVIGTTAVDGRDADVRQLVIAREYIQRAVSHVGSLEQLGVDGYLAYLLKSTSEEGQALASVTLELVGSYLSSFFRHAKGREGRHAVEAIEDVKQLLDVPAEQKPRTSNYIADEALGQLVTVAIKHDALQLPPQLRDSLRGLYERLAAVYSTRLLRAFSSDEYQAHGSKDSRFTILRIWSHTLRLGRWIGADMSALPRFGTLLLGRMLADRERCFDRETCLSLIDVLKEELFSAAPEHRKTYVGCVVAAYLAYSRACKSQEVGGLDSALSIFCRDMTVPDYSNALDYVAEAVNVTSCDAKEVASLLHLLKVVGLSAPEGTSKITQQSVSKTLMACADRPSYLAIPDIRSEVLGLLAGYCSDRPAYVRPSDMSAIWSILGQLLASSSEHEETTDPTVFQEIVNVVSALVRLRRDLVVNNLPHLGMILRRLTSALRAPRPQLGAKQTRLVMNTLPAWINAEKSMASDEAKALARLMTTLTTKTVVRIHGQNGEAQKPESLARPFSKHAAYVLTAYIEAVSDPLCHIVTQVRKELQPGLFALCDMLGEYNRDAMMVSALDANGKVMMKALWKKYEKQKYVGRG